MAKKQETKIELERIYTVPLRKSWLKVPKYRRVPRAVKELKKFLARHMKVEERDLKKVKLDKWLNEELWFRGIKYPPAKIKIKAIKQDGIIKAELLEIPEVMKFKQAREKKEKDKAKSEKEKKKAEEEAKKKVEEEAKKSEKTEQEKKDEDEKQKSTKQAGLEKQKEMAKQSRHVKTEKQMQKHQFRKALQK